MATLTADPGAPVRAQNLTALLRASVALVQAGKTLDEMNHVRSIEARNAIADVLTTFTTTEDQAA